MSSWTLNSNISRVVISAKNRRNAGSSHWAEGVMMARSSWTILFLVSALFLQTEQTGMAFVLLWL